MTAEVVAAIGGHLKGADRITQLWDLFENHRQDLEAIPQIWDAVEYIESRLEKIDGGRGSLTQWRYEEDDRLSREASPVITAEQARGLRAEVTELGLDPKKILNHLRIPAKAIEQIKEVDLPHVKGLLSLLRDQRENPPA